MKAFTFLLAAALQVVPAQTGDKQEKSMRAVMEESIARQRESLRKQVKAQVGSEAIWYTVPWPVEEGLAPIPAVAPIAPSRSRLRINASEARALASGMRCALAARRDRA